MLSRRTILLKPMQPALSGFVRLQTEGESLLMQLHARGLEPDQPVRLYWYLSGQAAKLIVQTGANAHGEICAQAEADGDMKSRLQAVLVIGGETECRPLLIGLCAQQDAPSLLDAKNAALALCERLSAARRPRQEPPPAPRPAESRLPREVFLPAIDPAPYQQAQAAAQKQPERMLPPPASTAPPVDRLRPLVWPHGFESLKPYFEKALPTALFPLPGWRFVYAAHAGGPNGLWIGIQQQDGCVCGVAYAHRGDTPPAAGKGFRPLRGTDGQLYQVLWQRVQAE